MRVLIAPDKFKGTLSAPEVAAAMASGLEGVGAELCPVADGGEGTAEALVEALGGEWARAPATDPLGRPITARYGILDGGETAIVEAAAASGFSLVSDDERDAVRATSRGTGELIADAIARGARRVLIACGGSAMTDGGEPALAEFDPGGAKLVALIDTDARWEECAAIYAPQKGASPDQVALLERRLDELAGRLPRDPRGVPGTGAAGGLSGGLWAHGAELVEGAGYVLDVLGFDERLARADLVITGEGRLDQSTLTGKAPVAVARRALAAGVPCHAIVGRNELDADMSAKAGFASVREASTAAQIAPAARAISG